MGALTSCMLPEGRTLATAGVPSLSHQSDMTLLVMILSL